MTAFDKALAVILKEEGGYVNHPLVAIVDVKCYKRACLNLMILLQKFAAHSLKRAA